MKDKKEEKKQEEITPQDKFRTIAEQYPASIEVHPRLRFEAQLAEFLRKHFKK
jgi:hypothetical protein